jgi:hypothetical protein
MACYMPSFVVLLLMESVFIKGIPARLFIKEDLPTPEEPSKQ